jgi:hypothetical protein
MTDVVWMLGKNDYQAATFQINTQQIIYCEAKKYSKKQVVLLPFVSAIFWVCLNHIVPMLCLIVS